MFSARSLHFVPGETSLLYEFAYHDVHRYPINMELQVESEDL
jgi:hypothetical protein